MAWQDVFASVGSSSGSLIWILFIAIAVGAVLIIVIGGIAVYVWNKKRWSLKVEFKLARSDGRIVNSEWGKGYFNAKRGAVYIKRMGRGFKAIPLKVFDVKKYLQGTDTLTVIQLSTDTYIPVLPQSFLQHEIEYINDETGEVRTELESIMNIKTDHGDNKAWAAAFRSASKQAYSLSSFFQQFQTPIAIAIVLLSVFAGFAMLWTKVG